MTRDDAWTVLGIEPTDDARAIRIAYTRRLKDIDPEIDPQAFILLRAAYDQVRDGSDSFVLSSHSPDDAPQLARVSEAAGDGASAGMDAAQTHTQAINALLYRHDWPQPWLDSEGQEALIEHWRALVDDPRMEEIAFRDRLDRWTSAVIAETSPLSAPILMLAAETFGWPDADANVHTNPHVAEIARRYRMLKLLWNASTPETRHHAAWIELTTPAGPFSSRGKVDARLVFDVITATRYALPQLEEQFDAARLEAWENLMAHSPGTAEGQTSFQFSWWMVPAALIVIKFVLAALASSQ